MFWENTEVHDFSGSEFATTASGSGENRAPPTVRDDSPYLRRSMSDRMFQTRGIL